MRLSIPILLSAGLLAASAAAAQKVEITPFYGFQFGGEFEDRFEADDFAGVDVDEGETWGVFANFALGQALEGGQIELMFAHQDTELQADRLFGPGLAELELEYWHVGFLYQWAPGQVRPYMVTSVGATRLDPEGISGETKFSWSIGGGLKLMFNDNVGLRLDGRFYSTLVDEDDDVFCDPYDCYAYDDSTYLFQADVKGGIIFAF